MEVPDVQPGGGAAGAGEGAGVAKGSDGQHTFTVLGESPLPQELTNIIAKGPQVPTDKAQEVAEQQDEQYEQVRKAETEDMLPAFAKLTPEKKVEEAGTDELERAEEDEEDEEDEDEEDEEDEDEDEEKESSD